MGGRGKLIEKEIREETINFINKAQDDGARLEEACKCIGITAKTIQNWKKSIMNEDARRHIKRTPANKLSIKERNRILDIANSPEYCNLPPSQIVLNLIDKRGIYIASESTLYRIFKEEKQLKHRGKSRRPSHKKPCEIIAIKPNALWSWDITYINSPIKGIFYYLYMIMDVFSRYIVGWEIHECESTEHSSKLMIKTCQSQGIEEGTVVLHSDNGGPMKGATMIATLQALGVMASFSRPRVSNDNPFSESLFKTLKYRPEYPSKAFASIENARKWVDEFVNWYNNFHLHSQLNFVTPASRHFSYELFILKKRKEILEKAKAKNPMRWTGNTRNCDNIQSVILNPSGRREIAKKKEEEIMCLN